jgi:hypothetical protein
VPVAALQLMVAVVVLTELTAIAPGALGTVYCEADALDLSPTESDAVTVYEYWVPAASPVSVQGLAVHPKAVDPRATL